MARIELHNVSVDLPVHDARISGLRKTLLSAAVGGRIGRDPGNRVHVRALSNIALSIEHGDRVGLVGHNGAGKSTLLRLLAGIYEPTEGVMVREGKIASLLDARLGIDMECTGHENIMLQGLHLGLSPRTLKERSGEIAEFTELGAFLDMPVRIYSAGMLFRLACAIAMFVEPDILLMDEWIGAGDARFLEKAQRRMDSVLERSGIVVLATHNLDLLRSACTKAILFDQGRIVRFGPVDEVIDAYLSQPVREPGEPVQA